MDISVSNVFSSKSPKLIKVLFLVCLSAIIILCTTQYGIQNSYPKKGHSKQGNIQQERLQTIVSVCEKYRNDPAYFTEYVEEPGEKMRGKFTLEPKGKLLMCNTMKQGTTTWARIFLQLYLPKSVNWSKQSPRFSPFNVGYQVKLNQLQGHRFHKKKKNEIVKSLEKKDHEYLAFFVCRNPIERLKSLYGYSLDLKRFKKGKTPKNFKDFLKSSFGNSSALIHDINPMYYLCAPCTRHFDAVIKMDSFTEDSRHILSLVGQTDSVHLSHSNNHGSQKMTMEETKLLFKGIPDSVIREIVRKLRPDFELCGYTDTLQWIESVLDNS